MQTAPPSAPQLSRGGECREQGSGMKPLRRKLIRTSLVTLGAVGLAVMLVTVILQLRISQRNLAVTWSQIERALESKGRLLVANQAVAMRAFVADNAFADLRHLLERTIADEEDLVYGAFVDRNGKTWGYCDRTIATADPNRNGNWRKMPPPDETGARSRRVRLGGEELAEFSAPIVVDGQEAGAVRYGVSLAAMRKAHQQARNEARGRLIESLVIIFGIGVLMMILGGFTMRRQATYITEPLAELSRAVQAIAGGQSGIQVVIHSGDEIEVLGAYFNKMVQSLEASYAELALANQQLKQQMNDRLRMEIELRNAQKLEAVGRLAAGIAHEINTPTQFVNDSIHFVRESMGNLQRLLQRYRDICQALSRGERTVEAVRDLSEAEDEADLPYLLEEIPSALDRASEGLARVATIVRSMKEFAHPGQAEMAEVDLNRAISTTLTIARSEYKYVAELETCFGDLPPVPCYVGEFNQAILNLVINAAHAVGDVVAKTDAKGRITVRTEREGDFALVSVSDTGAGIPPEICDHIFDPFFTTKEVGRGTGQGLPIARSVIVDKHRGQITFESEVGKGTTFFIRLPLQHIGGAKDQSRPGTDDPAQKQEPAHA
jgi:signal transduction histidine kinase